MAEITAAMVKELREQTGAGMMDCKKALNETNGNMEEAVEVLRKNGQAKAVKKEGRIAAEGLCRIARNGDTVAAVVEVNSETDFVAKNETFQQFVEAVASQAVNSAAADVDAFMEEAWCEDASKTVKEALVDKIAVIGEKQHPEIREGGGSGRLCSYLYTWRWTYRRYRGGQDRSGERGCEGGSGQHCHADRGAEPQVCGHVGCVRGVQGS